MSLADSAAAIGAVTRLLREHLIRRGFEASIGKPETASATDTNAKLNLFLYEVAFDAQLRNLALHDGAAPPLWLVLKYLLTAFDAGESSDTAAAHELLGRGASALHELNFLQLDPLVDPAVRRALEHNPEPLKLSFDDATPDLLSKLMQGAEERYRLSLAFQMRPVMIVPGTLPSAALLVGVDYTADPDAVIGRDGVKLDLNASLGARLERLAPERFEAGASLTLTGTDLNDSRIEAVLGDVVLDVVSRAPTRMAVLAEGSPGTPIAGGTRLSAGALPLVLRRRLSPDRTYSLDLLAARLLPTLTNATLAGSDLTLHGLLLGTPSDDIAVLLAREADGSTVRRFDTFASAAGQDSLGIAGAATGLAPGSYRVILRVNDQQALASPSVHI